MLQESKLLGKNITYPQTYCPEILVAVPRNLNREIYNIHNTDSLFCGIDSWHAYEASFILNNGMPVVGILKLTYSANSEYLVESKSLKLYIASYNMTRLGNNYAEATAQFIQNIENDLGNLLQTEVNACFFQQQTEESTFDFKEYEILENLIHSENLNFITYQEHPAFLSENIINHEGEIKIGTHLLKSNCKITNQPDWGSIYIRLKAKTLPDYSSILKYIVSLRNENHFHEEICEMTYKRLYDLFQPEILMVSCLYTRRGGIDICPSRANHPDHLPTHLIQSNLLTPKGFRQ